MKKEIFIDLINKVDSILADSTVELNPNEIETLEEFIENLLNLTMGLEETTK